MPAQENISEIFSMLHDGGISSWKGDDKLLTITVECLYLAELINPAYEEFYIELYDIIRLAMEVWPADRITPAFIITDYDAILNAEFEISTSDVKDGTAMI